MATTQESRWKKGNDTGESVKKLTTTQGVREKTDNNTGKSVTRLTKTQGSQRPNQQRHRGFVEGESLKN